VAVVTGGGGGIGGGICTSLAREGADIVVADINLEAAQKRASSLSDFRGHPQQASLVHGESI
ncbi:MAG: SDR family NAD(P)-dependent oxidoreductase, partial [Dehalococcoidia bacterium]|nr:SDR family NAD(P)-dependent oxidoreductase [Dehalococcoidia bacterium]